MRIDGAILDLDYTLFSPRSIPKAVFAPLFDAVRRANVGAAALTPAQVDAAFETAWDQPFDEVVRRHALPAALQHAWRRAQRDLRITVPLQAYPDVAALAGLVVPLVLVTSGYRATQESKIAALGIAPLFRSVHIDAVDEPSQPLGKLAIFQAIVAEYGWAADRTLAIGDSAESELAAGQELGMITVQVLRPGVVACASADYRIQSLTELTPLFGLGRPETAT